MALIIQSGFEVSSPHRLLAFREDHGSFLFECEYACGCRLTVTFEAAAAWRPSPGEPPLECPSCVAVPSAARMPPTGRDNTRLDWVIVNWLETFADPPPVVPLMFDSEPIIGWRVFRVTTFRLRTGVEPRLTSLAARHIWRPREAAHATCAPPGGGGLSVNHEAPWPSCHCGIWATRDRHTSLEKGGMVVGRVKLWGRVLEFRRGWRAEYAYPAELALQNADSGLAADLERIYGVPVTTRPRTLADDRAEMQVWQQMFLNGALSANQARKALELVTASISTAAASFGAATEKASEQAKALAKSLEVSKSPEYEKRRCNATSPHGPHLWHPGKIISGGAGRALTIDDDSVKRDQLAGQLAVPIVFRCSGVQRLNVKQQPPKGRR